MRGSLEEMDPSLDIRQTVCRVCRMLSRSPRTLLRQALERTCVVPHEFVEVLPTGSEGSVYNVKTFMATLSKGKAYDRVQTLRNKILLVDKPPDEQVLENIARGLEKKHRKHVGSAQAHAIWAAKNEQRRMRLEDEAKNAEEALQIDSEYLMYQRLTRMWKECGGLISWENFQRYNSKIDKSRGIRGLDFETRYGEIIFAMMALRLSTFADPPWTFSYQTNVHWFHIGKAVGEIDIILYDQHNKAVAICEMKTSCHEVAAGARQHEAKLDSVCIAPAGVWTIGKSLSDAIDVSGQTIPLFIATMLPSEKGVEMTGIEPAVLFSICQAIRNQGKGVMHPSNDDVCQPLVSMLQDGAPVDEPISYLHNLPPSTENPHNEDNLDFDQLDEDVTMMLRESLHDRESPLQCLDRIPNEQVLLFPRLKPL